MEPASITFVRHGETEANAADVWQGHGDSPLTPRGERQAKAFGRRVQRQYFDTIVTSDLGRAVATTEAVDRPFVADAAWRELDMGEWDGMAREHIFSEYADLLAELQAGRDIRWGGAESYGEFVARVDAAVDSVGSSLLPGQRALVITHGGVIHAAVAGLLGFRGRPRPWPVGRITNTSMTTIDVAPRQLRVFNDTGHLDLDLEPRPSDSPSVKLVRHGETAANVRGWWHGTTDLDLTPTGESQAQAVANSIADVGNLVASPSLRAQRTAAAIGERHGIGHETDARLGEMDFGAWEGLTTAEIRDQFPDEWDAVSNGTDIARGGSGETFSEVGDRMMAAMRAIAARGPTSTAVTHGGSIRVLTLNALGLDHRGSSLVALPDNTSTTSLVIRDDRVELKDFNSAAHLEA
ncbi:MAG: histidine phosphatase family protein [Acidimicrobiia bacterium]|nr:histidine phosphatase family protein [Acidimicrobiia bacterium]